MLVLICSCRRSGPEVKPQCGGTPRHTWTQTAVDPLASPVVLSQALLPTSTMAQASTAHPLVAPAPPTQQRSPEETVARAADTIQRRIDGLRGEQPPKKWAKGMRDLWKAVVSALTM